MNHALKKSVTVMIQVYGVILVPFSEKNYYKKAFLKGLWLVYYSRFLHVYFWRSISIFWRGFFLLEKLPFKNQNFFFGFFSCFIVSIIFVTQFVGVWNFDYAVRIDLNTFRHCRKTEKMIQPLQRLCQILKGHLGPEV